MNHPHRRAFLAAAPAAVAAAVTANALTGQDPGATQDPRPGIPDQPARTPKTKFAANIEMWFGKLPLLDRIRAAHALGFPAIEMWPWRGKDLPAIAALTKELGIVVAQFLGWGFSPTMNNPENHGRFVDEIGAGCEAAKQLDCKKMTVIAGNDQQGMTQAEMHDHVITALTKAAPVAEQHDVMLIMEPLNIRVDHKGHCLSRSEDAVRICRAVNSTHVKINWDLYHMQITEGDLCGRLKDGFDQVGYIQLADHPGRFEPGTGEIHYPRVLRQLHELGYRGYVGVECRPSKPEAEAAKALWLADQW